MNPYRIPAPLVRCVPIVLMMVGAVLPGTVLGQIYSHVTTSTFAPGVTLNGSTVTGGLVFGDLNNDGYQDLVIIYNTLIRPKVLKNSGASGTFTEVTNALEGRTTSTGIRYPNGTALVGDYDNDGDLDIFCSDTSSGYGGWLWQNNYVATTPSTHFTFTLVADSKGLTTGAGVPSSTSGILLGDFDADRDLDLLFDAPSGHKKLMLNSGKTGSYVYAAADSTYLTDSQVNGQDLSGVDVNLDGYTDFMSRNTSTTGDNIDVLFFNQGSSSAGKFLDGNITRFTFDLEATNQYVGVSTAFGDYDNSGTWDVVVQNKYATNAGGIRFLTRFYLGSWISTKSPPFSFTDMNSTGSAGETLESEDGSEDAGGAVLFGDMNNDGLLDLFVGQEWFKTGDKLYKGLGPATNKPYQLDELTAEADVSANTVGPTEAAALVDWDLDGDLDLYVHNNGLDDSIFKNGTVTTTAKNYLRVRVTCAPTDAGSVSIDCIGATVMLFRGGDITGDRIPEAYLPGYKTGTSGSPSPYNVLSNNVGQSSLVGMRQVSGGNGIGAQESLMLHFGLPTTFPNSTTTAGPDAYYTLRVLFPGGKVLLRDVKPSTATGYFNSKSLDQFVRVDITDAPEDGDGIPASEETSLGTDKQDLDSDDDGLLDSDELWKFSTNPALADTDSDGLWDGLEKGLGLVSGLPDGISDMDGTESNAFLKGTDLTKLAGHTDNDTSTKTDPRSADSDQDGISDGLEDYDKDGAYDATATGSAEETDPLDLDTDDDGLFDGSEKNGYTTTSGKKYYSKARLFDSDGDILYDGTEVGLKEPMDKTTFGTNLPIVEGVMVKGTPSSSTVFKADSDGGTKTTDPLDSDTDDDLLTDGNEDGNTNGRWDSSSGETDPTVFSTDGGCDGDGKEKSSSPSTNPLDASDDSCSDPDGDGCSNQIEKTVILTNPNVADTDGDGIGDCTEGKIITTTNPACTNPNSTDSDGDNVQDGVEDKNKNGIQDSGETNPCSNDSDGDLIPDGREDLDRDGAEESGESDPLDTDSDEDGILDGNEDKNRNGVWESYVTNVGDKYGETKSADADTDRDGLPDGLEVGLTAPQGSMTDSTKGNFIVDLDPAATTDPNVADTDGDRLSDGEEDKNKNGRVDSGETDPNKIDTDGDGCNDFLEVSKGTNPTLGDTDGDGLSDCEEINGQGNELDPDTDDDGLLDGEEVNPPPGRPQTNPELADTDGDGLSDGKEVLEIGTNPVLTDTDSDLLSDGSEVNNPTEPTNPLSKDTDADGIQDDTEVKPSCLLDAQNADSDGDGLKDGEEDLGNQNCVFEFGFGETDPLDDDTDDDGLFDGTEKNNDPQPDDFYTATDPRNADSDGDGVQDGTELGLTEPEGTGTLTEDPGNGDTYFQPDLDPSTTTDPLDDDSDGDVLRDGDEDANGNGQQDAASPDYETDPTRPDSDSDDLEDGEELFITMTDPLNPDTDGGCELDGSEVFADRDPLDGSDDACADADGDGLGNDAELRFFHSDPQDADTDDDGILDGEEPGLLDLNGDGIMDTWDENEDGVHGSDEEGDADGDGLNSILDPDSDNDGILDGTERGLTSDSINQFNNPDGSAPTWLGRRVCPVDASSGLCEPDMDPTTTTNPLLADTDGGGSDDGAEDPNHNGRIDAEELDPSQASDDVESSTNNSNVCEANTQVQDSDCDGLTDREEEFQYEDRKAEWVKKNDNDTDDDGVLDGDEANWTVDTDLDGMINVRDVDSDNDGVLDGTEKSVEAPASGTNEDQGVFVADLDPSTSTSMLWKDSDFGGADDGAEDPNHDGAQDSNELNPMDASDEAAYPACPSSGPLMDSDCDGLTDAEETSFGSRLVDADSDDDGVKDSLEDNWTVDTDLDGLLNVRDPDSDADLIYDGTELSVGTAVGTPSNGTDPSAGVFLPDIDQSTRTTMIDADTDGGLVPDGVEDANRNGRIDGAGSTDPETDPNDPTDDCEDNDGDALCNTDEDAAGTDKNDADTDDDGLIDSRDGTRAYPWNVDFDSDGLINARDPDSDNDGIKDGTESGVTTQSLSDDTNVDRRFFVPDAQPSTTTSMTNADTDGNGVSDGAEDPNHNGDVTDDPAESGTTNCGTGRNLIRDTDCDGLSDAEEEAEGSDPEDSDTDDDGVDDGREDNWTCDMDIVVIKASTPFSDAEVEADGIDVLDSDSDGDGVKDGTERGLILFNITIDDGTKAGGGTYLSANQFVEDADPSTETWMVVADSDGDSYNEGQEDCNLNGAVDCVETDPLDKSDPAPGTAESICTDTDGDGVINAVETELGTDIDLSDSDGDYISDLVEIGGEVCITLPIEEDLDPDSDGKINPMDDDSDGDDLEDCYEAYHPEDSEPSACGDEWSAPDHDPYDTDDDGTPDYLDLDSDADQLLDDQEAFYETDPYNPDTDGGGGTDGEEVLTNHTSPLSSIDDGTDLRGGGCSISGSSSPAQPTSLGWAFTLGACILSIIPRRRRLQQQRSTTRPVVGLLTVVSAAALLFSTPPAGADATAARRFSAQNYRPALDMGSYFSVWDSDVLKQWHFNGGMSYNYAFRPLTQRYGIGTGQEGAVAQDLVGSLMTTDFYGGLGLTNFISLHLSVPVSAGSGVVPIYYDSDVISSVKTYEAYSSVGLGDAWIAAKLQLLDPRKSALGLALIPELSAPVGGAEFFFAEATPTFRARLAADSDLGFLRIGGNVAYRLRPTVEVLDLLLSDTIEYGVALKVPVIDTFDISTELVGSFVARNYNDVSFNDGASFTRDGTSPLEVLVGAHYTGDFGLYGALGAGVGLNDGVGAPSLRGFGWVGYRSPLNLDEDGDGIPDRFDKCPKDPENFNGVMDEDGCPEPDTDNDGIVDPVDACPTSAEDFDHFQDEDGCPELDNDGDGIPDAKDQCPNEAEDKDGFEDSDGCPDGDNDRDGLNDAKDRCPNQAEDFDGFQDNDGCPEADNDQDGIMDSADKCPNDPEDRDSFEDEDGCPDLDNDKDGILDPNDKCPNEAEVINSVEDEDGCPDEGTQMVFVKEDRLVILFPVHFEYNKAIIRADSEALLNQVARTLIANPYIKRVRIEGHTDWDGDDNFNMKLSQERAESVRDYLAKQGVDFNRMDAQGFGETQPIASNKTAAGRERNRRVEFIIVEREEKIKLRRRTEENAPELPKAP